MIADTDTVTALIRRLDLRTATYRWEYPLAERDLTVDEATSLTADSRPSRTNSTRPGRRSTGRSSARACVRSSVRRTSSRRCFARRHRGRGHDRCRRRARRPACQRKLPRGLRLDRGRGCFRRRAQTARDATPAGAWARVRRRRGPDVRGGVPSCDSGFRSRCRGRLCHRRRSRASGQVEDSQIASAFVAVAARADRPRPARTRGRPRRSPAAQGRGSPFARCPCSVGGAGSDRRGAPLRAPPRCRRRFRRRGGRTGADDLSAPLSLVFTAGAAGSEPASSAGSPSCGAIASHAARRRSAISRHTASRATGGSSARSSPPARSPLGHSCTPRPSSPPTGRRWRLARSCRSAATFAERSASDPGDTAAVPVPHHEGVFAHQRSKDLDEQLSRLRRGRVAFVRTCRVLGRPLRLAAAVGPHGLPAGSRPRAARPARRSTSTSSRTSSRFAASPSRCEPLARRARFRAWPAPDRFS